MKAKTFRPFEKPAQRRARVEAIKRRRVLRKTLRTLEGLKARVAADTLTAADHRVLAMAGPETLKWLGYERKVSLT